MGGVLYPDLGRTKNKILIFGYLTTIIRTVHYKNALKKHVKMLFFANIGQKSKIFEILEFYLVGLKKPTHATVTLKQTQVSKRDYSFFFFDRSLTEINIQFYI
jgi:hypothetical protein